MENTTQTNYTLVIVALVIGVLIGFFIGTMTANSTGGQARDTNALQNNTNNEPTGSLSGQVESTLVEGNEDETAFTLQVSSLSSAQQTMLRGIGVDGESIVITKGMVACAEASMGAERVVSIQNGAAITMSESITLASCYTAD